MSIEDKLRHTVQAVNELWADPIDTAERLARLQERIAAEPLTLDRLLLQWLQNRAANHLERSASDLDPLVPLIHFGLDSITVAVFLDDLRAEFGLKGEVRLETYTTLERLSGDVATLFAAENSIAAPRMPAEPVSGEAEQATSRDHDRQPQPGLGDEQHRPVPGRQSAADGPQTRYLCWLLDRAALLLRLPAEEIDPEIPLTGYGMDSLTSVEFSKNLQEEFGLRVSTTLLWDYPTLESLSSYLAGLAPAEASDKSPEAPPSPVAGPGAGEGGRSMRCNF